MALFFPEKDDKMEENHLREEETMTCPYCGKEVAPGSRYCLYCGTRQEPVYIAEEFPEINLEIIPEIVPEPIPEHQPVAAEVPAPPAAPVQPKDAATPKPKPAAVKPKLREVNKLQLPTKRGLAKMFFLGIITMGIYPVVIWSRIVTELNIVASRHDGRRTMPYFAMVLLTPFTLGILPLVWMHNFCCRIGDELNFRRINYRFAPRDFWLWNVLGSLILVGPFVFVHKLMKAMNMVNDDFNRCG